MRPPAAGDVVLPAVAALPPIRTRAAAVAVGEPPSTPPDAELLRAVAMAKEEKEAEPTTTTAAADAEEEEGEPRTPTSEESKLRPPTECPPAPRKPAWSPMARPSPGTKRRLCYFGVPRDLSAVFMASLPPKKRIRAPPRLIPCRARCGADGSAP